MPWRRGPERVVVDEAGVRRFKGGRVVETINWSDLASVAIRTTSAGPFGEDVYWLLVGTNGTGVAIPQGAAPEGLLDRLQTLPGFDSSAVIAAMGSTSYQLFHCWGEPLAER
jgi:hypothetical protein